MIIDKIRPFYTQDELQTLDAIEKEKSAAFDADDMELIDSLDERKKTILDTVSARYAAAKGQEGILADAMEIIGALEKEDYLIWQKRYYDSLFHLFGRDMPKTAYVDDHEIPVRRRASICIENCSTYILSTVVEQLSLLENEQISIQKEARKKALTFELPFYESATSPPLSLLPGLKTIARRVDSLDWPIERISWNLFEGAENGQLSFNIRTSPKNAEKEAFVTYSLTFKDLEKEKNGNLPEIVKRLTPFDKRVYLSCAALFNAGNNVVSETQIYKLMGYNDRPAKKTLDKIHSSLTKMRTATILLDTKGEIDAGMKYDAFFYDGDLLPFERVSAYINGKLCEGAVHLFREPPLVSFARQRKQITTILRGLLVTPLNKTDENIRIEDYLIDRIAHIKKNHKAGTKSKNRNFDKILYSTICENCNISGKQKQRLPEKVDCLLLFWTEKGHIAGYNRLPDGVEILP